MFNHLKPLDKLVMIILLVIAFGCIIQVYFNNVQIYSLELQEQGYSKEWADHKAAVEYYLIPADDLYQVIQED